jgi:hypothetical protein
MLALRKIHAAPGVDLVDIPILDAPLQSGEPIVDMGAADLHGLDLPRFAREKKQRRATHHTTTRAFTEGLRLLETDGAVRSRLLTPCVPSSERRYDRAMETVTLARGKQAVKVMPFPMDKQKGCLA